MTRDLRVFAAEVEKGQAPPSDNFPVETITPEIAASWIQRGKKHKSEAEARKRIAERELRMRDIEARRRNGEDVPGGIGLSAAEMEMHQRDKRSLRDAVYDKVIDQYAKVMEAGGWAVNGMPIIFDKDGNLIDGEARVMAVLRSGTAIRSVVARDVAADTLHTIDQHRRRSYSDVIGARGYILSAAQVVALMGRLAHIENGQLFKRRMSISWSRYDRILEANPALGPAVELSREHQKSPVPMPAQSALVFMAMTAGHTKEIETFLAALSRKDPLPPGNPAEELRKSFRPGDRIPTDIALGMAIQAFNDFLDGKSVSKNYTFTPKLAYIDGKKVRYEDFRKHPMRSEIEAKSLPNFGLPLVKGYPGLKEGRIDTATADVEAYIGRLAEEVKAGVQASGGKEFVHRAVTVTPSMAEDWLARFNRSNRKVSQRQVSSLARDIIADNWMINAQPICFASNPFTDANARLLNGQHRLLACILAGQPIEVPIAVNIAEEAFATFDLQAKRSRMDLSSDVDTRVVQSVARMQWKIDQGHSWTDMSLSPTAMEIQSTVDAHPRIIEAVELAKPMLRVATHGAMAFFIYSILRDPAVSTHHISVDTFLRQLRDGADIEPGSPIPDARSEIIAEPGERGMPRKEVLKRLFQLWDDYKTFIVEGPRKRRKSSDTAQTSLVFEDDEMSRSDTPADLPDWDFDDETA